MAELEGVTWKMISLVASMVVKHSGHKICLVQSLLPLLSVSMPVGVVSANGHHPSFLRDRKKSFGICFLTSDADDGTWPSWKLGQLI